GTAAATPLRARLPPARTAEPIGHGVRGPPPRAFALEHRVPPLGVLLAVARAHFGSSARALSIASRKLAPLKQSSLSVSEISVQPSSQVTQCASSVAIIQSSRSLSLRNSAISASLAASSRSMAA